ncbi:Uncharacterised protein [Chlamydia trachomatis]|nr:Uncharacterised protein [Chlamydia trachomatis]
MEVGDERRDELYRVGRIDVLIGPAIEFLYISIGAYGGFEGTKYGSTHCYNMLPFVTGFARNFAAFGPDEHLFVVLFVLREVFDVLIFEVAQPIV